MLYLSMEFDQFLKAALPPLGYDWRRHRRKGVRRKLLARLAALGLDDFSSYLERLSGDAAEIDVFRRLLTVTISRFYRDPPVFDRIRCELIPRILGERGKALIWSAGSASGEEPYTLAMIAEEHFPGREIRVVATDMDSECMARAEAGVYEESSVRKIPPLLKEKYFRKTGAGSAVDKGLRRNILFVMHDILTYPPVRYADIVLCRNLAYTYVGQELRLRMKRYIYEILAPGGYLVLGRTESLPEGHDEMFASIYPEEKIYLKI